MAGKIPQSFIDTLLARADVVDIIDSRVPLKKAGKEYKACCPFHEERTPSFTVSPDKQFYHCFGCGAHGTAIGFLMEYDHMDFVEAVESLAARYGLEVEREAGPEVSKKGSADNTTDLLETLSRADRYFREQLRRHPGAERAVHYLKQRGLTGAVAARFGLGFAPPGWDNLARALGSTPDQVRALTQAGLLTRREGGGHYDRFRDRVMFPIHDHRGRVVGFGGRVLGDDEPKYLNSPETPVFHKGSELYGLHLARGAIRDRRQALIVEGYMDVLALAQHGIDYAVATLGTATTRAHLERIYRHCPEVVFCFDGDRAGRAAAWKALHTALGALRDGRQASFLFLPEGHDPDSLVRQEGQAGFEQRLAGATPLPDYLVEHLAEDVDLSRLDGRARLIELARPLLAELPPGVLKSLIVERLTQLARTERRILEDTLGAARPSRGTRSSRTAPKPRGRPRSAVAATLTLLVQHPALARIAGDVEHLAHCDLPGANVVYEIIHSVREQPGLNTAAILERFRNTRYFKRLSELAGSEQLIDEAGMEHEFHVQLGRIRDEIDEQELNRLLDKVDQAPGGVSSAEKARLRELLARRSAARSDPFFS